MLLILLLDPHWKGFENSIADLFLLVIGLPIVAWLAVRADRRRDERGDTTSRAWSTKKAIIAVLLFIVLVFILSFFRH
jgi:cytochrome c oxidase assembly factor CtaG